MVRNLSGVAIWSGIAFGIWLLSLSAFSAGELVVGAACSLVVGLATLGAQRVMKVRWSPTLSSLRPLLALPAAIVANAASVLTLPLRPPVRGHFATRDIRAKGGSARAMTRRAVATLATTATPGSMVVDVDRDEGEMTVHALPVAGPRMEERFGER